MLRFVAALKILHYYVVVYTYVTITMEIDISEEGILTVKQVASYLKVTERTIYRLATTKKIPAFKVGGAWRFSRADIDSWIRRQSKDALTDTERDGHDAATGLTNDGDKK